jgi:hypothetical protein
MMMQCNIEDALHAPLSPAGEGQWRNHAAQQNGLAADRSSPEYSINSRGDD